MIAMIVTEIAVLVHHLMIFNLITTLVISINLILTKTPLSPTTKGPIIAGMTWIVIIAHMIKPTTLADFRVIARD